MNSLFPSCRRSPASFAGTLIVCLVLASVAGAPVRGADSAGKPEAAKIFQVAEHRNVAYRDLEQGEFVALRNLADLYLPKDAEEFPVVVLVHGGAWVSGDKTFDYIPEVGRTLARQGIGVVAPNYRLSPFVKHPAHVADVARAVAWARKEIPAHGGRTDGIFLFGHSAGGHLVSLLASDERHLKGAGLSREDIKAVIAVSGVYQVTDLTVNLFGGGGRLPRALTASPFALAFGRDPEVGRQASPITHVQAGLPPFLVLYAEEEFPTLAEMAESFGAALAEKECDFELVRVRDRNHLTILWQARSPEDHVARMVVDFVRKHSRATEE
jgi:acetyl esterase/lipase